jgi:hypothetical protein
MENVGLCLLPATAPSILVAAAAADTPQAATAEAAL